MTEPTLFTARYYNDEDVPESEDAIPVLPGQADALEAIHFTGQE